MSILDMDPMYDDLDYEPDEDIVRECKAQRAEAEFAERDPEFVLWIEASASRYIAVVYEGGNIAAAMERIHRDYVAWRIDDLSLSDVRDEVRAMEGDDMAAQATEMADHPSGLRRFV